MQVLCNGGMATLLAAFYIMDVGVAELPVNFYTYYRASWLSLGVMGMILRIFFKQLVFLEMF